MQSLPIVIAHRGACGYRPEHTRAAYELAFEQGADAVEPDLVVSQDGVLVIRHENEISTTTDVAEHPEFASRRTTKTIDGVALNGWFTEDFTWAELGTLFAKERLPELRATSAATVPQRILRFTDLLDLLDTQAVSGDRPVALVAEVKHASYFESIGLPLHELFAAELRAAGWHDDDRLTVESFERSVLQSIHGTGVRARLVFLVEREGIPADEVADRGADARPYSWFLTDEGLAFLAPLVTGLSVDKRILQSTDDAGAASGSGLVDRAHTAGLSIYVWTLRAENVFLTARFTRGAADDAIGDWMGEFTAIMLMGVDGVFSDQPDLAIRARQSLGLF